MASLSADSSIAARAEYNLGQHYLARAGEGSEPDTAIVLLRTSILRSRAARLRAALDLADLILAPVAATESLSA